MVAGAVQFLVVFGGGVGYGMEYGDAGEDLIRKTRVGFYPGEFIVRESPRFVQDAVREYRACRYRAVAQPV